MSKRIPKEPKKHNPSGEESSITKLVELKALEELPPADNAVRGLGTEARSDAVCEVLKNHLFEFHRHTKKGWLTREKGTLWKLDFGDGSVSETLTGIVSRTGLTKTSSRQLFPIMLRLLRDPEPFDEKPHIIGTSKEKIVNLKTGKVSKPKSSTRVTMRISTHPVKGKHPRWSSLINHFCKDDYEKTWLQKFCGYCLTGSVKEDLFLFFQGGAGGGKSTFGEVLEDLFGDYGSSLDRSFFNPNNTQHRSHIARLDGKRLAYMEELPTSWGSVDIIKKLVSGGTFSANHMRQETFEFPSKMKLIACGNSRPTLGERDSGFSRRLVLIPIPPIEPKNRDIDLRFKVREKELPQIAFWFMEGAKKYFAEGLGAVPERWQVETEEYLSDEDVIYNWFRECTEVSKGSFVSSTEAARSFSEFSGKSIGNGKTLKNYFEEEANKKALGLRNVCWGKNNRGTGFKNLKIRKTDIASRMSGGRR